MQNKNIPIKKLVGVLKASLERAIYSATTMNRHICCVRRIYAFMEEKGIEYYTPPIGRQFGEANDKLPLFEWAKAENRTVTNLLDLIILGIPFTQRSYQPRVYKLLGDFSEDGELFLEKLKAENRLATCGRTRKRKGEDGKK